MKNIHLQTITIEGFRSIVKPVSFVLDRTGLNLLKGSNGAGKTTLFEAICWALYGINLKSTNTDKVVSWPEIRGAAFRGTRVSLFFQLGATQYEIHRHISFKGMTGELKGEDKLMIFENGQLMGSELDKKNMQLFIDETLGVDAKTFVNSILFGQRMAKLVEADNSDKRKLFEELFDLFWVDTLRAKVSEDKTSIEATLSGITVKKAKEDGVLQGLQDKYEQGKTLLQEYNDNMTIVMSQLNTELSDLKEDLIDPVEYDVELHNTVADKVDSITVEYTQNAGAARTTAEVLNQRTTDYNSAVEKEAHRLNDLQIIADHITKFQLDSQLERVEIESALAKINITGERPDVKKLEFQKSEIVHSILRCEQLMAESDQKCKEMTKKLEELAVTHQNCPLCSSKLTETTAAFMGDNIATQRERLQTSYDEAVEVFNTNRTNTKKLNDELSELTPQLEEAKEVEEAFRNEELLKAKLSNLELKGKSLQKDYDNSQSQITALGETITSLDAKCNELTETLNAQRAKDKELKSLLHIAENEAEVMRELHDQWESREDQLKEIEALKYKIEQEKNRKAPSVDLSKTEADIKEAEERLEELVKREGELKNELEVVQWWLNKGLGASGIKSFVFKASLEQLNQHVMKYANRLGVSIHFSIDMTKASRPFSTVCSVGDKRDKDYNEFSGGEKQRLDICLMFGMHDMISALTNINILLCDEIFDGLDEEGEATVFDLIRMKAENKSVYVISHSAVLDSLYSSTVEVINENGVTQILNN